MLGWSNCMSGLLLLGAVRRLEPSKAATDTNLDLVSSVHVPCTFPRMHPLCRNTRSTVRPLKYPVRSV
jgi:hypothetical protein